jgi:methylmalonyl-CoA mutase cobalamin-binding domain/chain
MASHRILLSKLGLDGHDRAIRLLARAARDEGHEVILLGIGVTPAAVAAAAIQEDVDVIGISLLSGAQMVLLPELIEQLAKSGAPDIPVVLGGTIPSRQVESLVLAGVREVLGTGTPVEEGVARLVYWAEQTADVR